MNFIPALISIILTLFVLLLCGYFCRKLGIINNESSKGLSKLIISIGQPAMIIGALANAEYNDANVTIAWQVLLIGFAMHFLLSIIALPISRLVKHRDQAKIFEFHAPTDQAVRTDDDVNIAALQTAQNLRLLLWTAEA